MLDRIHVPPRGFAIALLVCIAAGCGDAPSNGGKGSSGAMLYQQQGCATCHGAEGQGGPLGPKLAGIGAMWKRDALVEYLKDPLGYAAKDERLAKQAKQYSIAMTKFDLLPQSDLESLADYVMAR